jgi:HipA-like protein
MVAGDGSRWVMKANYFGGQHHRYLCLNEALCGQIARRLGVSVPQAAVVQLSPDQAQTYKADASEPDRFVVASQLIEPAEPLSPASAAGAETGQVAGIVAFDALVRNTDRKEEHVLAQRREDDGWQIWAIDHGNTLATADTLHGSFDELQPAQQPMTLLRQQIGTDDVAGWCETAATVSRLEFKQMVDALPGAWVVEPDASETLADILFARAQNLGQLLAPHLA